MIKLVDTHESADNSIKFLWELPEVGGVESLFMYHPSKDFNSLCLSTQIGCAVGCKFCHVPLKSRPTNLSSDDIISQAASIIEYFEQRERNDLIKNLQITYFGAGEPMHNLGNVIKSKSSIKKDYTEYLKSQSVGRLQSFSISTSGWEPGIKALTVREPSLDLQVSLHATNEETRNKLIPANNTFTIEEILEAAEKFSQEVNRKVTLNYLLINGLNDTNEDLEWLRSNIDPNKFRISLAHLNNPRLGSLEKSPQSKFLEFEESLADSGIEAFIFESDAKDVDAGCGQMKGYKKLGNINS